MRLQIVSDLHVDIAPAALRLAPGAGVLVVAGDICEVIKPASADEDAALHDPEDKDWLDEPIICDD